MKIGALISTVVLIGGFFTMANADVLYTPPVIVPALNSVNCRLVNVSGSAITPTLSMYDTQANLLQPSYSTSVNSKTVIAIGDSYASEKEVFCKFSVSDKTKVRAEIAVSDGTGQYLVLQAN
jgi:hypothetical protein